MSLDFVREAPKEDAPKTHIVDDRGEPEFSMSKSKVRLDLFNK